MSSSDRPSTGRSALSCRRGEASSASMMTALTVPSVRAAVFPRRRPRRSRHFRRGRPTDKKRKDRCSAHVSRPAPDGRKTRNEKIGFLFRRMVRCLRAETRSGGDRWPRGGPGPTEGCFGPQNPEGVMAQDLGSPDAAGAVTGNLPRRRVPNSRLPRGGQLQRMESEFP